MAEAAASPAVDATGLSIDLAVDSNNFACSTCHERTSSEDRRTYRDVGVQTDPPSPPLTPQRLSVSPNLIDFSPSPPRTPPRRSTTSVLTAITPPSRSTTPTPSTYSLRTPTKQRAYSQVGRGRPRSKTLFALGEEELFNADAVEELQLRSYIGHPPSKLHIPRPLEQMDDNQDVFAVQSTDLSLALGRRVVSMPTTADSAVPTNFTRPRAVSDSLAALAYAAVLQEAEMLLDMEDAEAALTGRSLSHARAASLGLSDSSSLTSMETDDDSESLPTPNLHRAALDITLANSITSESFYMTDKPGEDIVLEPSPPKAIPALHGPLSLPYARCPSGAEGIIVEEPATLHRIVWGLEHEPPKSEHPAGDGEEIGMPLASEAKSDILQTAIEEVVQAMPKLCGVVNSDGLARRRAADLAPRRRTLSSPATHTPTKSSTSSPIRSSLRANAPPFFPSAPQMRRVTIDPAILYVSPPGGLQSPIILASDRPGVQAMNDSQWTQLAEIRALPFHELHAPSSYEIPILRPPAPCFPIVGVPYSAESLNLLQRLTMSPNNIQSARDPRSELGHGRPSTLLSRMTNTNPNVARRVTHITSRPRAQSSPPVPVNLHPVSHLTFSDDNLPPHIPEEIEIITTPATPVTPISPYVPANIDRTLLQANGMARAAARTWSLSEQSVPTAPITTQSAPPVDWSSSFKTFWREQQTVRGQEQLTENLLGSPIREHSSHEHQLTPIPPRLPSAPRSVPMKRLMTRLSGSTSLPALSEVEENSLADSPAKRFPSSSSEPSSLRAPIWQRPQSARRNPSPSRLSLAAQTKADAEESDDADVWIERLPAGTNTSTTSNSSSLDEEVIIFQGWKNPKGKGRGVSP
ncbi:hypothetical protein DACRYDRAFT_105157 [Dacryopinax primogenitus]|uniref:Uncharacterized protein n=1 Tax=Dacryopinax primogenitus (strain DJM 731) TaxID=1858805 RepID=M5G5U3_DACPD|nr:uncharacterized protein DACRYDRAFT_105157 [Dacryopinax primogenitus]EJU04089.1 hypothetical protein DACRYDRAFT_105157 [Dacryopinax primogenitus]